MDQMQTAVTVAAGSLAAIAVIMLAVCLKLNSAVNRLLERQADVGAAPAQPPQACVPAAYPAMPEPAPALKLNGVEEPTAAMLMAIVAHTAGVPLEELRFISIKEC